MGGNGAARGRQPPLLPKWLAAIGEDEDRRNAHGPDQQRRGREARVFRIAFERQQCASDAPADVFQSQGAQDDP